MEKSYTHEQQLFDIMNNKYWEIRRLAASRIDISYLPGMLVKETDKEVIKAIMKRLKE